MKFDILNRFTGAVQFTSEINCREEEYKSLKIGLAVRWAIANRASLDGARLDGASLVGARYGKDVPLTKQPVLICGLYYPVFILDHHMKIGCELHTLVAWSEFDDERITKMDGVHSRKFWRDHKDVLLSLAKSTGRPFVGEMVVEEAA